MDAIIRFEDKVNIGFRIQVAEETKKKGKIVFGCRSESDLAHPKYRPESHYVVRIRSFEDFLP